MFTGRRSDRTQNCPGTVLSTDLVFKTSTSCSCNWWTSKSITPTSCSLSPSPSRFLAMVFRWQARSRLSRCPLFRWRLLCPGRASQLRHGAAPLRRCSSVGDVRISCGIHTVFDFDSFQSFDFRFPSFSLRFTKFQKIMYVIVSKITHCAQKVLEPVYRMIDLPN